MRWRVKRLESVVYEMNRYKFEMKYNVGCYVRLLQNKYNYNICCVYVVCYINIINILSCCKTKIYTVYLMKDTEQNNERKREIDLLFI